MPPALSDDDIESDGPDMIPAKGKIPTGDDEAEEETAPADVGEDEEDDEDEDEDEYRVEKILQHAFSDDGVPIYLIKWLGYEKKADQTWEPIENLENAKEIVEAYHATIGGAPQQGSKAGKKKGAKGGKRSASAAFAESPLVEAGAKKGRRSTGATNGATWSLPEGSWETHVSRVSSIIEDTDTTTKRPKGNTEKSMFVLLEWNDKRKTQHPLDTIRRKCPQKLLDYYEQHLVFRSGGATEGDD